MKSRWAFHFPECFSNVFFPQIKRGERAKKWCPSKTASELRAQCWLLGWTGGHQDDLAGQGAESHCLSHIYLQLLLTFLFRMSYRKHQWRKPEGWRHAAKSSGQPLPVSSFATWFCRAVSKLASLLFIARLRFRTFTCKWDYKCNH